MGVTVWLSTPRCAALCQGGWTLLRPHLGSPASCPVKGRDREAGVSTPCLFLSVPLGYHGSSPFPMAIVPLPSPPLLSQTRLASVTAPCHPDPGDHRSLSALPAAREACTLMDPTAWKAETWCTFKMECYVGGAGKRTGAQSLRQPM